MIPDDMPTVPEPDWSTWEEDAEEDGYYGPDCFIMSPWGDTAHYFHADEVEWYDDLPNMEQVYSYDEVVDLDPQKTLGIDWRTTLRRRPEATE